MLILIEGVDRTGKTSVANDLKDELGEGTHIVHFGAPRMNDPVFEYIMPIADYVPGGGMNIIMDRGHIGELVWPRFFGRDSIFRDAAQRDVVETWLDSRGCVLVLAQRALGDLARAFEEADPPEPLPVERVSEAHLDFVQRCEESALLRMTYDHSFAETGQRKIIQAAYEAERRASRQQVGFRL